LYSDSKHHLELIQRPWLLVGFNNSWLKLHLFGEQEMQFHHFQIYADMAANNPAW
jgi:hypothetical protein